MPLSHPVWVRGLKPFKLLIINDINQSHPVWVRGLKHNILQTHRL